MALLEKKDRPVRVGIVGVGGIGEVHVKAFQALAGVEIVAVCDASAPRVDDIRAKYDIRHGHTDWQDLVERKDIDVVSVATPNYLHMPVTVAALNAGKHVLSEKPLARTAAEGQAMVDAAVANDRVLSVSFNHRYRGDVRTLKQVIDAGTLGRVYYAKSFWLRRQGVPFWGGWFSKHELAGGGPLIDLGVHMLDMTLYLLGEPEPTAVSGAVYSELAPRGRGSLHPLQGEFDVEDLSVVFVRLEGGGTLLLEASWAGYGHHMDDFGVELFGTDAGAQLENREWKNTDTLRIFTDVAGIPTVSTPRVDRLGKDEGHVGAIRDFLDVVLGDPAEWKHHRGHAGLKRARIIEAAYESAKAGREIVLK
jgi:predicted dehydrogenase